VVAAVGQQVECGVDSSAVGGLVFGEQWRFRSRRAFHQPPPSELEQTSALALSVEPNPVTVGSHAALSIEFDGLPADAAVGAGAEWQCWNGSQWVTTHRIVRAFTDQEPVTLEVPPGATTTIPAIGLNIPNTYQILIPHVIPGMYRIADRALVPEGEETAGFVLVEVR
jgi:hypothetical protein